MKLHDAITRYVSNASPVEERNDDRSCNLHHWCTWTEHTPQDVVAGLAEQSGLSGW